MFHQHTAKLFDFLIWWSKSWAWSNSCPAGSPPASPDQSPFDFSRSIPAAWSQIGSWIDSFHPGTVNIGHTRAFTLSLPFIPDTGLVLSVPITTGISPLSFLLKLRYLKQDKTFYFTAFIIPTICLSVMGALVIYTQERKLNCPWNLLSIVRVILHHATWTLS